MTKIIYLIKGRTGDYEDSFSWLVKGFSDKIKANSFCEKLNDISQKGHISNFGKNFEEQSRNYDIIHKTQSDVCMELEKIDPKATIFGSGTHYSIEEVSVEI